VKRVDYIAAKGGGDVSWLIRQEPDHVEGIPPGALPHHLGAKGRVPRFIAAAEGENRPGRTSDEVRRRLFFLFPTTEREKKPGSTFPSSYVKRGKGPDRLTEHCGGGPCFPSLSLIKER